MVEDIITPAYDLIATPSQTHRARKHRATRSRVRFCILSSATQFYIACPASASNSGSRLLQEKLLQPQLLCSQLQNTKAEATGLKAYCNLHTKQAGRASSAQGPLLCTPGGTRYAMPTMSSLSPDHLPEQCVCAPQLLHAAPAADARKEIIFHLAGLLQQHGVEQIADVLVLSTGSPLTDAVSQTLQDGWKAYEKHLLLRCECRDDTV